MRFSLTSDLHGQLPPLIDIPQCDYLIIAGDIMPDHYNPTSGLTRREQQRQWYDEKFLPWVNSLFTSKTVLRRVLLTWGNHDFGAEKGPLVTPHCDVSILHDSSFTTPEDIKIYGIPYVTNLSGWAFNRSEDFLKDHVYPMVPDDTTILISHAPPNGVGDYMGYGNHVGSTALRDYLCQHPIPYVVCGHIHPGYGEHIFSLHTKVFNAARLHDDYRTTNPLLTLDIPTKATKNLSGLYWQIPAGLLDNGPVEAAA